MHDDEPELTLVEEDGLRFVEGPAGQALLARTDDAALVVEACLSHETMLALLHSANLTPAFFDLSSREAGEVLQKLRNYRVRLAVVAAPGSVRFSRRFGEMMAEERRGVFFGVFETRPEALEWLKANQHRKY
jgi:hypothetical protein